MTRRFVNTLLRLSVAALLCRYFCCVMQVYSSYCACAARRHGACVAPAPACFPDARLTAPSPQPPAHLERRGTCQMRGVRVSGQGALCRNTHSKQCSRAATPFLLHAPHAPLPLEAIPAVVKPLRVDPPATKAASPRPQAELLWQRTRACPACCALQIAALVCQRDERRQEGRHGHAHRAEANLRAGEASATCSDGASERHTHNHDAALCSSTSYICV